MGFFDKFKSTLKLPANVAALLSPAELKSITGMDFRQDREGPAPGMDGITGAKSAAWIAPPLVTHDTGVQRNTALIAVVVWSLNSAQDAEGWLFEAAQPLGDIEPMRLSGLGEDAIFSDALLVRIKNIVFSVRFAPYTRAPRESAFLQVEGPIAELLIQRMTR